MYIYILNSVINVLFPFGTEQVTIIPKGAGQRKQGGEVSRRRRETKGLGLGLL
jgi:hypothetical protein